MHSIQSDGGVICILLVNMNRHMLERLDDWALVSACHEPLILAYKAASAQGEDGRQLFSEMTPAQQALFIFKVYHDHVCQSVEELYWWSAYFMAESGRWAALIGSLRRRTIGICCRCCRRLRLF